MKLIGLTGNTGSGKSLASAILAKEGAYVIDSDKISHEVLLHNKAARDEVMGYFGESILDDRRNIDRKALGRIVFSCDNKLAALTEITHKYILADIRAEISEIQGKPGEYKYIVVDAPLLIESGLHKECDEVWAVYADDQVRLQRIMARDGIGKETALKRFNKQTPFPTLKAQAHVLIENNGSPLDLENKIKALLNTKRI